MDVDLQACIDGDPAAWGAFVAASEPLVRATVRKVIGSGRAARSLDDVVQDVFVRLVRNDFKLLRTYDPAKAALTTWIALIARSTAIDAARRRELDTSALATDPRDRSGDPEDDGPDIPEMPLHLLSERQRLVIRLLFDEDRSVPEAAAILDVDEQTIRSTKHKALTRLRAHFDAASGSATPGGTP